MVLGVPWEREWLVPKLQLERVRCCQAHISFLSPPSYGIIRGNLTTSYFKTYLQRELSF